MKCLCGHQDYDHTEWGCRICHCFRFETEEQAREAFRKFLETIQENPAEPASAPTTQPEISCGCLIFMAILAIACWLILWR